MSLSTLVEKWKEVGVVRCSGFIIAGTSEYFSTWEVWLGTYPSTKNFRAMGGNPH